MNLHGKKVIFIAPEFFGYDKIIEDELVKRGALVSRLKDRPFSNSFFKAFTKIFGKTVSKILDSYYLIKIAQFPSKCDLILVVNGQTISRNILLELRNKYPVAKFVLYMWDSIINRSDVVKCLDLYNERFSFDKDSVDVYGFRFRPLFYGEIEERALTETRKKSIIISFVGTAHSDRYSIVKAVSKYFNPDDCFWFLYLQAPWVFWWRKLFNKNFSTACIQDFKFTPLKSIESKNIFNRSEIILDIEHPDQTGLTIRTFDAMRSGKKLITTNTDVINYDFYLYGNVQIISREKPYVPNDFINRKFRQYSDNILYFYSITGWLDDVLSNSRSGS